MTVRLEVQAWKDLLQNTVEESMPAALSLEQESPVLHVSIPLCPVPVTLPVSVPIPIYLYLLHLASYRQLRPAMQAHIVFCIQYTS